eukprot:362200-Chlamydomonas_euryale.AAC.14
MLYTSAVRDSAAHVPALATTPRLRHTPSRPRPCTWHRACRCTARTAPPPRQLRSASVHVLPPESRAVQPGEDPAPVHGSGSDSSELLCCC